MAVIKDINKGVYKRKLYKRVDFSILDSQFNQWYSNTPPADRMFGWAQEEAQLRGTFEGKLNEDRDKHSAEDKKQRDDFISKYNGKQVPQEAIDENERQLRVKQANFEAQEKKDRETFNSKLKDYSIKVYNPQSTSANPPKPTSVAPSPNDDKIVPIATPLPDTPQPPTSTSEIDPIINPSSSINNGKSPTSTNVVRSKDGRGGSLNHEEYISDTVDNNNDTSLIKEITKMSPYATIPLLFIIIIAIVAVVCAAIFVMKKRQKTRQFNAEFGFKPDNFDSNNEFGFKSDNFDSNNEFSVMTENNIITENIINEYANEYTQSEVQDYTNDNGDNQITNVETAPTNEVVTDPTNDVVTTEEYTNNQGNYAFTPQYNVAYTTEMPNNLYPEGAIQAVEPVEDQPISHYSPSLEGKELTIDDFIPLIQGR